jgi:hypothetical protein
VRDSPVPWYCRAQYLNISSFKAAIAFRPCVQRWDLQDSSAAWRALAKFLVRPGTPVEVSESRRKSTGFYSQNRKIRYIWREILFRYLYGKQCKLAVEYAVTSQAIKEAGALAPNILRVNRLMCCCIVIIGSDLFADIKLVFELRNRARPLSLSGLDSM